MDSLPVTSTVEELNRLADAYPPLDRETQEALAVLATRGDEKERKSATDLLFKHNASRFLYFARLYAKDMPQEKYGKLERAHRYMLRWKDYAPWTMTSDEVISAVLAGFWRAVKTFDPAKGKFNTHANLSMWREIQKARKREERRGSNRIESIESIEATSRSGREASHSDEKEFAWVIFVHHLEKICPDRAKSVLDMLDGKVPEDKAILAEVGERLRSKLPPGELAWLEEYLA